MFWLQSVAPQHSAVWARTDHVPQRGIGQFSDRPRRRERPNPDIGAGSPMLQSRSRFLLFAAVAYRDGLSRRVHGQYWYPNVPL